MASKNSGEKLIASNKKALHDYFVLQKLEAGIELTGTEVKSLRDGRANRKDSYVAIERGGAYVLGTHISLYSHGNLQTHDPERNRRLRLHKGETEKVQEQIKAK